MNTDTARRLRLGIIRGLRTNAGDLRELGVVSRGERLPYSVEALEQVVAVLEADQRRLYPARPDTSVEDKANARASLTHATESRDA